MKETQNNTKAGETMTDWDALEKDETHILFRYRRGNAICEIRERSGVYYVLAYREATPHKKQDKSVSKAQAASIAAQARDHDGCEILFDHHTI